MMVPLSSAAYADDPHYLDGNITSGPQMLQDVEIVASDVAAVEVVDSGILLTTVYGGVGPGNNPLRGSVVDFSAGREHPAGDVVCGADSRVSITLADHTRYTGAINDADSGAMVGKIWQ
jgi:hypothetical protein